MPTEFYDYIRGLTENIPEGYELNGMRVYRYLVYIGASQIVQANFPEVRKQLGEDGWQDLIKAFVRDSNWASPYYGDLKDEFLTFIERKAREG